MGDEFVSNGESRVQAMGPDKAGHARHFIYMPRDFIRKNGIVKSQKIGYKLWPLSVSNIVDSRTNEFERDFIDQCLYNLELNRLAVLGFVHSDAVNKFGKSRADFLRKLAEKEFELGGRCKNSKQV